MKIWNLYTQCCKGLKLPANEVSRLCDILSRKRDFAITDKSDNDKPSTTKQQQQQ